MYVYLKKTITPIIQLRQNRHQPFFIYQRHKTLTVHSVFFLKCIFSVFHQELNKTEVSHFLLLNLSSHENWLKLLSFIPNHVPNIFTVKLIL